MTLNNVSMSRSFYEFENDGRLIETSFEVIFLIFILKRQLYNFLETHCRPLIFRLVDTFLLTS